MKKFVCLFIFIILLSGCESMNQGASKAGEAVGKTTKVVDSISEGAVDGYMGKESPEDNPYNR